MSKQNRREAMQSLASIFMLGGAAGTVAYIKRDELSEWLPAKRRQDWEPAMMILTEIHPQGITRSQANAINSTKVKQLCDELGLDFIKVYSSDDLTAKSEQFVEMKEMLELEGQYGLMTVSKDHAVRVHKVPADVDLMLNVIRREA